MTIKIRIKDLYGRWWSEGNALWGTVVSATVYHSIKDLPQKISNGNMAREIFVGGEDSEQWRQWDVRYFVEGEFDEIEDAEVIASIYVEEEEEVMVDD